MISLEYVAGFFDGEGYVGLELQRSGSIQVHISITNTRPEPLYLLQQEFGGHIQDYVPKGGNNKRAFRWQLNGNLALTFLRLIHGHLIIKKGISELAISVLVLKQHEKLPKELKEDIIRTAKSLNKRGVN